jgi:hypothetical protein
MIRLLLILFLYINLNLALSFLTSRKRLYFGLDEGKNQLIYYKDKADFDKGKDCQGSISLEVSFSAYIIMLNNPGSNLRSHCKYMCFRFAVSFDL